jgi:hypothetical protein
MISISSVAPMCDVLQFRPSPAGQVITSCRHGPRRCEANKACNNDIVVPTCTFLVIAPD